MHRRLSQLLLVALVGYWLLIFAGTHWPKLEMPEIVSSTDKVAHVAAFFGLAILLAAAWRAFRRLNLLSYGILFLLLASYGALDELSQLMVPGRSASWFDWLADLVGGAAGLLCFAMIDRWRTRRNFAPSNKSGQN